GVNAIVRVHVPAVSEASSSSNSQVSIGTDPDRRVRFLQGLGGGGVPLKGKMGASHVYGVLRPEALDGFQILLEPVHALPLGCAKSEGLDLAIAQRYTKNYLATTHNVHRGNLFGNVQGFM